MNNQLQILYICPFWFTQSCAIIRGIWKRAPAWSHLRSERGLPVPSQLTCNRIDVELPFFSYHSFLYESLLSHSVTQKWRRGSWYVNVVWKTFSILPRFGPLIPRVLFVSPVLPFFPTPSRIHFFYCRKTEQNPAESSFSWIGFNVLHQPCIMRRSNLTFYRPPGPTIGNISFYQRHNRSVPAIFCFKDVWMKVAPSIPTLAKR